MKRKMTLYSEAAYLIGLVALALGTALMERADFGMSMVVAPAYILHLKVSEIWAGFSFGVAEYCLQALLLIITAVVLRKFKPVYLLSFFTAFIYGSILDTSMSIVGIIPEFGIVGRILFYVIGMIICAVGVSMLFHTYFAPEAYELLVKEISSGLHTDIHKTKTVYDIVSCIISVLMSFVFFGFGRIEGVKAGTIFCALINGWLIGRCTMAEEKVFDFKDAFAWRKYFA